MQIHAAHGPRLARTARCMWTALQKIDIDGCVRNHTYAFVHKCEMHMNICTDTSTHVHVIT